MAPGVYPDVSLLQARKLGESARDLLRAGTDPGIAKRRQREQNKLKNAQVRYRELTGWACPAQGGPRSKQLTPEQKATDREARLVISSELGPAREVVTAIYFTYLGDLCVCRQYGIRSALLTRLTPSDGSVAYHRGV